MKQALPSGLKVRCAQVPTYANCGHDPRLNNASGPKGARHFDTCLLSEFQRRALMSPPQTPGLRFAIQVAARWVLYLNLAAHIRQWDAAPMRLAQAQRAPEVCKLHPVQV